MKRGLVVLGPAVLALSLPLAAGADSAETKWVRGKVTALGPDSVTVNVSDKEMKFSVDKETAIIARGAGTKMRAAQKEGAEGVKLSEVVKVGEGVEVHYHDVGATLHASEIRAGISVGKGKAAEHSGKSVSGTVKAVAMDSLTVSADGRDWTFTVDAKTKVVGRGAGTLARKKQRKGEPSTITSFVSSGDSVIVSYHEMGATLHAGEVRVRGKVKAMD